MNREQIRSVVLDTIASIAPDVPVHAIPWDRPLRDEVDLDSLDWLNVMTALRERLGVDIPASVQTRLDSVEAIVDFVASGRPADAAPPPPETAGVPPAEAAGAPPAGAAPPAAEPVGSRHVIGDKTVTLRPLRAEDMALEAAFVQHLSTESRYNRFMVAMRELPASKLDELTHVDQQHHVALVATAEDQARQVIVGVVRYIADASGKTCEFAIAVDDAWQGSGLAGILMHALIEVARAHGVARMEGLVLRSNDKMLRFTRQLGFERERNPEDHDTVRVVRSL